MRRPASEADPEAGKQRQAAWSAHTFIGKLVLKMGLRTPSAWTEHSGSGAAATGELAGVSPEEEWKG